VLTYSSAGHPPGIVVLPDGEIRLLDDGRAPSLAVEPGIPRRDAEFRLPGRSTLLLYTDGLVERRRRGIDTGIALAGQAAAAGREATVAGLADQLMTGLLPPGGNEDDAALLLYRHPRPLELSCPAQTSQLAPSRAALRDWLARCDLPRQTIQDVVIATGEAFANAIEHGRAGVGGHEIRLTGAATPARLHLTVRDNGRWPDPRPGAAAYRGHGIPLMRAVMSEVTITPGPMGTRVDLQLRITP
jgi:anti-sigma regulatory factor (Ser/Thr protein kinase)